MADPLFPDRTEFDERVARQPVPSSSVHDASWGESVPVTSSDVGWASFTDAEPSAGAPPAGAPSLRAWTIRSDAEQRHIDRLMARMTRPQRTTMTARQMVAEATAAADAQAVENMSMSTNVLHERRFGSGSAGASTTSRHAGQQQQQQQQQQRSAAHVEMSDRRMLLAQTHRSDARSDGDGDGDELEGNDSEGEDDPLGDARGGAHGMNAMRVSWRDICCCWRLCPT